MFVLGSIPQSNDRYQRLLYRDAPGRSVKSEKVYSSSARPQKLVDSGRHGIYAWRY